MCSSERRPAWRSKPPSLAKQLDADRKFMSVVRKLRSGVGSDGVEHSS